MHINIGPNLSPLLPPEDKSVVVLAIEANTAIANRLREDYQKRYPNRFFVINVAVSGPPLAGSIGKFTFYNSGGQSSSLSKAVINSSWADTEKFNPESYVGPGAAGFDFVAVLSLQSILSAIPNNIVIDVLKTDTQGHDFAVIRSAVPAQLRRVRRIITETYLNGMGKHRYKGVTNDLEKDWIPYMSSNGFFLSNPPDKNKMMEYDALWKQV